MSDRMTRLEKIIAEHASAIVAYSGGTDSGFLLNVARIVLGDNVIAATISNQFQKPSDISFARQQTNIMGVRHEIIEFDVFENTELMNNPPERCYLCKKLVLDRIDALRSSIGYDVVFEGSNADDGMVYRPGSRAVKESKAISPLAMAGIGKAEIRNLAEKMGLPFHDRPSSPCLATRLPYGHPVTEDLLSRIAQAEDYLDSLGFRQIRARTDGDNLRIEVPESSLQDALKLRKLIVEKMLTLGYKNISLDLEGFESGRIDRREPSNGS